MEGKRRNVKEIRLKRDLISRSENFGIFIPRISAIKNYKYKLNDIIQFVFIIFNLYMYKI